MLLKKRELIYQGALVWRKGGGGCDAKGPYKTKQRAPGHNRRDGNKAQLSPVNKERGKSCSAKKSPSKRERILRKKNVKFMKTSWVGGNWGGQENLVKSDRDDAHGRVDLEGV